MTVIKHGNDIFNVEMCLKHERDPHELLALSSALLKELKATQKKRDNFEKLFKEATSGLHKFSLELAESKKSLTKTKADLEVALCKEYELVGCNKAPDYYIKRITVDDLNKIKADVVREPNALLSNAYIILSEHWHDFEFDVEFDEAEWHERVTVLLQNIQDYSNQLRTGE